MQHLATRLEIPVPRDRIDFGRLVAQWGARRCKTKDIREKAPAKRKRFRKLHRPRKKSACSQFLSSLHEAYRTLYSVETFDQTRSRLVVEWAGLPPDQKWQYQAQANQLNDARAEDGSFQYRRMNGNGATEGKASRRRSGLRKLSRIRNHAMYKGGLQLCCYESGLKACHVDSTSSDSRIAGMFDRSFSYNPEIIKNPPSRSMQKTRNCYEPHGGLCGNDWGQKQAANLTSNMYVKTRRLRSCMPVLNTLTFPTLPMRAYIVCLTTLVRTGKTAVLMRLGFVRLDPLTHKDRQNKML